MRECFAPPLANLLLVSAYSSLPPSGLTLRPRSLGVVLQVRGVQHSLHSEEVGPLCARVVSVCVHPRQARQWPPLVGVFSCHGWLRPPPEGGLSGTSAYHRHTHLMANKSSSIQTPCTCPSTIHYPLSTIHVPLSSSTIHYPSSTLH